MHKTVVGCYRCVQICR